MKHNGFFVDVHKTDVVSVDDLAHSLPPSRGIFDGFKVADYNCPPEWSKDGFFIPVEENQPMWFDFRRNHDECACLPSVQRLNPVTGEPADLEAGITKDPEQNYLVLPEQLWLDGYAKDGKVYQFMVTKEGIGLAVSETVLPKHMQDSHAIAFVFYRAKHPKPRDPVVNNHYSYGPYWQVGPFAHMGYIDNPLVIGTKGSTMRFTQNPGAGSYNPGLPMGSAGMSSGGGGAQSCSSPTEINTSGGISAESAALYSCEDIEIQCNNLNDPADIFYNSDQAFLVRDPEIEEPETVDMLKQSQEENLDKASMGMGGRIKQKIVTDDNSIEYYNEKPDAIFTIYMALPEQFKSIMDKGNRQDASRKDKHVYSGQVGGVQVPLVKAD